MTHTPAIRTEWTIESILDTQLPDECGTYLRYEPVYDDIKEARREDDPQLSQGVWQTDLKRANWVAVEHLCVEALTHQTRDLQLALWLTEALAVMDGPNGLIKGLQLTNTMSQRFWDHFHPTDEDFRIPLWEWVDQELNRRLILLPITHRGHSYSDWLNALNLESVRQRSPERVPGNAVTVAAVRKALESAKRPFSLEQIDTIEAIINQIRDFLGEKVENAPGFTVFRRTLQELKPLCKPLPPKEEPAPTPAASNEVEPENTPPTGEDTPVVISERSHAYQAIRDIGTFLATLEPHSPVPQLLIMAGRWENSSLPQILTDIQQRDESRALMHMLGGKHLP